MVGKCVLLLLGVVLSVHPAKPESEFFECPRGIWNGEKIGKFVGVINQDHWVQTNYLFKPDNKYTVGCVQVDEIKNPARAKLMWDAYKSNTKVRITVTGNHEISGIKIEK